MSDLLSGGRKRSNLYKDADGNLVKGRYIYKIQNGEKYIANMKYPAGYTKSGTFYCFEDAVSWIEGNWERFAPGWYYDEYMQLVILRKPGEARPKREF